LFRHAPEKIRSDLARRLHDLAEAKGRPPALAEAMVDMDLAVFYVRHKTTGEETFLSQKDIDASDDADQWEKVKPVVETGGKRFLTINGTRAVELRMAQGTADSRDELVARYGLQNDPLILERTGVDTAVTVLNFPLVTGLLFVIGLVALYVEFSAPGIGMGGLVAGLCFSLFFWSRFLGGTAGWLEVILFVGGIAFLAVEIFVLPGFGVAGLSGLLLIFFSILMASQNFVIPRTAAQLTVSLNAVLVLAVSGISFVIVAVVLSQYFNMLPVVRSLILETPGAYDSRQEAGKGAKGVAETPFSAHRFPVQVGDWGIAESPLRPAGKVRFAEHYVDVVTDGSFVDKGRQVRVVEISGNRVVVREIEATS
jgi:membrane-bound serine protease (ClpP class)